MPYNDSQPSRRCKAVKVLPHPLDALERSRLTAFLPNCFVGFEGFVTIIKVFCLKVSLYFVPLRPLKYFSRKVNI